VGRGGAARKGGRAVLVNGQPRGDTPIVADLDRKDQHRIRIELEGYPPYEVARSCSVTGWVWGNLVFGGIPGLAVGATTGGLYQLSPEPVMAELREAGESEVSVEDGRILVTVVLRAGRARGSLTPTPSRGSRARR